MVFVDDGHADDHRFRCLMLTVDVSCASPAIEVAQSFVGNHVVKVLEELAEADNVGKVLFTANATEFTSKAVDQWACENQVKLDYSGPGKATDNAFIGSFNGRLPGECLNQQWFTSLADAKETIERWR